MSLWTKNLATGKCGRCGKRKPARGKTRCAECSESVTAARAKWAVKNPAANQANKNAYWQSDAGKKFIRKRRKKFNEYRKKWRASKKELS